ncbi:MAG: enoyl-CoA hydratase [Chloroflexi bacterium]|nr:enoyl-CoA hydratase [Chloroflexota bacterium]
MTSGNTGLQTLILKMEDGLAIVTLNRPDRMNTLTEVMAREISETMDRLHSDDGVRAVLLRATGRAFCAGMDLSSQDFGGATPGDMAFITKNTVSRLNKAYLSMLGMEKPLVCAVNGVAAGGGLSMVMSSDIVVASESATFCTVAVRRGLFPDVGMNYLLPRIVGLLRAKELLFTADIIDAREAHRIGLVNRVVPDGRLDEEAATLARRLASGASRAIGLSKTAVHRGLTMDVATALQWESWGQGLCMQTEDVREGIMAFVEKRQPNFKGR